MFFLYLKLIKNMLGHKKSLFYFPSIKNQTELWHKRLGHFHQTRLVHIQKKKMVQGMSNLEEEILVCTSCQYGKQNRLPFPLNKA